MTEYAQVNRSGMFAPFSGTLADSEDIADHLHAAMNAQSIDGDWKKEHEDTVVHRYRHSSAETRDMVNQIFAAVCGYSFARLAKNAGYQVYPHEPPSQQVRDWRIQMWEVG